MIDTVKFWYETTTHTDAILARLENVQTRVRHDTGEATHTGAVRNFHAFVTSTGFSLNGSLAKFAFGNNVERLTRRHTAQATEELSDCLCMPIGAAKVYRLDVGANMIVRKPVITYLQHLGEAQYFTRAEYGQTGLLFKNGLREMVFYDKAAECRKAKETMPSVFAGQNVLRYEFRYMKRLGRAFQRPTLHLSDVSDETLYSALIRTWRQSYNDISKQRRAKAMQVFELKDIRRSKDYLAYLGMLSLGGSNELLSTLKAAQKAKIVDKHQAKRLREMVKELNAAVFTEEHETMQELDRKIREAAAYFR
jgi:hypothetical protein